MSVEADKELGAWLRDNEALLYKMAWTKLRDLTTTDNYDDVEMVVADTMWRAWRYRHLYHGGSLKAWVSSVMSTSCHEVLRQHRYENKRRDNFMERLGARGLHTTPSPEYTYTLREQIRQGLDVMDAASRQAVLLKFIGYDYHEIASEMGIPLWKARTALARGRAKARSTR